MNTSTNKSLQQKVYINKTRQAHQSTYGSLTKTNQKTIYTSTLTV